MTQVLEIPFVNKYGYPVAILHVKQLVTPDVEPKNNFMLIYF